MIKVSIVAFFFVISSSMSNAQNRNIDSLKLALSQSKNPVERFYLINEIQTIVFGIQGGNIDSSACIEMLQIARRLNNDSLLAIGYNWIGQYLTVRGDNVSALEYFFKAIPLALKVRDKRRISSVYFDISSTYLFLQNYDEAFNFIRKGGEYLPDTSSEMYDYMLVQYQRGMATNHLIAGHLDSALFYGMAFEKTSNRLNSLLYQFGAMHINGSVYGKSGNHAMAEMYFNRALALEPLIKPGTARLRFIKSYIPYLLANRRFNEARSKVTQLLTVANNENNNDLKLALSGYMREVYEALQKPDSAYYYSRVESNISSLIFSQNNINRIQAFAFNEQLRGMEEASRREAYKNQIKQYGLLTGLAVFFIVAFILFRNNRQKQKANMLLERTLSHLKATQSQLIQSEKMASLGELTAGIAHEIQNPLNFVNNFSEINKELLAEAFEELRKGDIEEAKSILNDVCVNEEKINHHGKRADAIVKGMLQHSRTSGLTKEPTDINKLADEYLRLAYHGLRAKDNSFNATLHTDFDGSIGNVNIIPQDIGRVILNIINNAFHAVDEKKKSGAENYEPTVTISTKKEGGNVLISIKDNGNGIPQKMLDKIFQPFFTTKPTGSGTGLGLSLTYDIIKAHGGEINVKTADGEGAEFIITLPLNL